jgi:hypothetical protein
MQRLTETALVVSLTSGGILCAILVACSHHDTPPASTCPAPIAQALSHEELLNPSSCAGCHNQHYGEWSNSMHAYASEDPLFRAMNRRAQREQSVGTLCVNCHAPMAVRTGMTTDGMNLDQLKTTNPELLGVTCYFCHSVAQVTDTHNAPIVLATDDVLRASIADPCPSGAHTAEYSPLHDRNRAESAQLCGSCHDVQNTKNVAIENTFKEWRSTIYSADTATQRLTCAGCHMLGTDGFAANIPGLPPRKVHAHSVPAVDLPLTDFGDANAERQGAQELLDTVLVAQICVYSQGHGPPTDDGTPSNFGYKLDNAFAGHDFPSGAVHDRRAWVELTAYQNNAVIFQTGVVPSGQSVTALKDNNLWLMRETLLDTSGNETRMLWEAAQVKPQTTFEHLTATVTLDSTSPAFNHSRTKYFRTDQAPDRITAIVHMIPVGLDVLDDLIQSGDLDSSYRDKMPVFTLASTKLEWSTPVGINDCFPKP